MKGVADLRDLVARLRTGAVINDQEAAMYDRALSDEIFSDANKMAKGIAQVRQALEAKLQNQQASFAVPSPGETKSPLDLYSEKGGSDFRKNTQGGRTKGKPYKGADGKWYVEE
jgi:hypothetical protein